ncbi:MAG: hypothetical protein ACI8QS_000882 [Planctomycetota bacterium]|jgi:hypothetical protein
MGILSLGALLTAQPAWGSQRTNSQGFAAQTRSRAPAAATATALPGHGVGDLNVVVPPLWYSGDSHEHIQLCPFFGPPKPGYAPAIPLDRTPLDIYAESVRTNLNVSAVSVWRPPQNTEDEFFNEYLPLISGFEDPATIGDANFIFQYGVEGSGFATSIRGHLLALGITDGSIDPSADYPSPNLTFLRSQPQAIAGYAHQAWPSGLTKVGGYLANDYRCMTPTGMDFPDIVTLWGSAAPVYAPMDAAHHNLDFLETVDMELISPGGITWTGMWYRLLSAGVPVQAVAGTDTNCFTTQTGKNPRTWVQIGSDPLTFNKWTAGISSGNYSMAMGPSELLELEVNGNPAGSTVYFDSSLVTTVPIVATFTAAAGVSLTDTIEILVDGEVVHSQGFTALSGTSDTIMVDFPLVESCWITARTTSMGSHTGFVQAIVDNKPIVDCESDEYFVLYAEYLEWFLDLADSQGMIEDFVGDSETEIRSYIQNGAEVFDLHRAYDLPLPTGIQIFGTGTPSCEGPMGIVTRITSATAGSTIRLECFDSPTAGTGYLIVSSNSVLGGYAQGAATVYVANDATSTTYPIVSDDRGLSYVDVPLPLNTGEFVYAQFLYSSAASCGNVWSASEAFCIQAQ